MSIPSRQIGWSQESNLLWNISKQLNTLTGISGTNFSNIISALSGKITNEQGVPAFYADTFINIPAPGQPGRLFVSTDTFAFYRDNGVGWDLIGGPGTGTVTGTGTTGKYSLFSGSSVIGDGSLTEGVSKITSSKEFEATKLIATGGTSAEILAADGSVITAGTNITITGGTISAAGGAASNIYTTDGTLSAARTLTHGGFNLTFVGSTHTNRFTAAGRLLLGTTTESTFLLDVNGTARVTGANELIGVTTFLSGRFTSFFSSPFVGFDVSGSGWSWQIKRGGGVQFTIFGGSGNANFGNSLTDFGYKLSVEGTLNTTDKLSVGAPVAPSAIAEIVSTTKGFLPPRMDTTQKNAIVTPAAGLIVYDTTLNKLCVYTTGWETITSL